MTELEPYRGRGDLTRHDTDSWTQVIAEVGDLASKISNTEFVPESLRGKTAAVAAAILSGREMGVPPMTALSSIHVIKGRPAQSAQLMRQLVLAAGHQLRTVEATDTRCVVEGRRKGEEDWQQVVFTADQARKARIDLGTYPEDKLYARATSRLCRRAFADVLGGMPYSTEELEDGDVDVGEAPALPSAAGNGDTPEPAKRTMQRRSRPRAAPKTSKTEPAPAAAESESGPPLPGEDGYNDITSTRGEDPATAELSGGPREEAQDGARRQPAEDPDAGTAADAGPPAPRDESTQDSGDEPMSNAMRNKLFALFRETDFDDRADRLTITGRILERQVGSWGDLTKQDATVLIDMFEALHRDGRLVQALTDLLSGDTAPADTEGGGE